MSVSRLHSELIDSCGTVDVLTRRKMSAVRHSGTAPEIAVRSALESLGIGFSTNINYKPGRPDIWLIDVDVPVFVHGCFWHRHTGCSKASTPKKNREFWLSKFKDNKERDARVLRQLKDIGYSSITVWQCETTAQSKLRDILVERIGRLEA